VVVWGTLWAQTRRRETSAVEGRLGGSLKRRDIRW
jgi:hypothetical protein